MKRIYCIVLIALFALVATPMLAQRGGMGGSMGGGRGGQGGGAPAQRAANITAEQLVGSTGLFTINIEEIIENCKVKDDATIGQIRTITSDYLVDYDRVMFHYLPQLDSLELIHSTLSDEAQRGNMQSSMRQAMQIIQKIKVETIPTHKSLNDRMLALFVEDKKATKRWSSYYASVCKKNLFTTQQTERPKRPMDQNSQGGERGKKGTNDIQPTQSAE